MTYAYFARTKIDAAHEKAIDTARNLLNLYEDTMKDLVNIAIGCRALLAEMNPLDDASGKRAELMKVIERLDRALAALRG